jgi:CubicO group peptidase (beta-lactamase class C family)
VAALSIGVQRGGDVLLTRGYGLADIENDVPATAETVYRIGSITKQFTAAAVMQLVQAGEIGLGDLITDHLPDYPMQGHEVTIRHLLTHTSGIKSYTSMESWRPKMRLDLTDEELVAIFGPEPFDFAPGERYLYNNSGYYLLGVIIGEASGEPYQEYLNAHLFGTLDLAGSFYCDERPIFPRDGGLWSQATGQGAFRLRSQGDGTFVPTFDDAVEVSFVVEDARATSLILVQGGRREAPRAR